VVLKVSHDIVYGKNKKNNAPAFRGFNFVKSDTGVEQFQTSCPFDSDKDNCYLEVYKLDKDTNSNYFTTNRAYTKDGKDKLQLQPGSNKIDLSKTFGISDNQPFAYHYMIVDKDHGSNVRVKVDAGDVIDERSEYNQNRNIFNIVMRDRSKYSKGGSGKLVILDSHKVGYVYDSQNEYKFDQNVYDRGVEGIKTLANKFGGNIAGFEYAVDNGEFDSYDEVFSLPLFTDDDFTAHGYWNRNCFQISRSLGNINNYSSLQRKLFAHGLNLVSDGAFVNEGLQGVHFSNLIKWGENSPYKHWFKASSLKDGPLSLGIFVKNKEYISHKIVNHPRIYYQDSSGIIKSRKNLNYDKTKPTYIQFFDRRYVTGAEREDSQNLIKSYSKMVANHKYELHSPEDSIYPYSPEIDPKIYSKNIDWLNDYNYRQKAKSKVNLDSPLAARLLSKSTFYVVDGKFEGGFDTWDANPDIAKLSFSFSNADSKQLKNVPLKDRDRVQAEMLRGICQVQDYSVDAGKYWTQKTDDILRLYIAQNLKSVDSEDADAAYEKIINLSDNKNFPRKLAHKISKDEVENVLWGTYKNKRALSTEDKQSQILEGLMNTPLDSIEFGDNIVAALASPLISKRASIQEEIGVSRYELYKAGNKNLPEEYKETYEKMDSIYTGEMASFATKVLDAVNNKLPEDKKLFEGDKVTEYGKYVLPLLTPEIARYAITKSLVPDLTVAINPNTGEMTYDYDNLKETYLQKLGIEDAPSPKAEAKMLLNKIQRGIHTLDSTERGEMADSIYKTLKYTNLESFKLADLIIDKAQSGLDWRIDATKDIADVIALKDFNTSFDVTWKSVTNFWRRFAQGILEKNPNSYIVAEITDERDLWKMGSGAKSPKYSNIRDIVSKFLRETGISSIANYSYFFSTVSNMFSRSFEHGGLVDESPQTKLYTTLLGDGKPDNIPFIRSGSLDSLIYSYNFIGNHDKPRALHCCALDMNLFYLKSFDDNWDYRRRAYQIVENKYFDEISDGTLRDYPFYTISPKAVAMADALQPVFVKVLTKYAEGNSFSKEEWDRAYVAIHKALADLTKGILGDKQFNPEAFGCKPIDVAISAVIKQASDVYGFGLPARFNNKQFENDVFEAIMTPAVHKLQGMMKYLVALPGIPTMFDGDDAGATGYDSKTKNMYLQGRQKVHDEWLDEKDLDHYKEFLANFKNDFDKIMAVRKNPNCQALNDGAIFPLKLQKTQHNENVTGIFRQSPEGRMAITLFNPIGLSNDHKADYNPAEIYVDRIYLDPEGENLGIPGLPYDTEFKNVDESDKGRYFVKIDDNGRHYITRVFGNNDVSTPITDSTLILYDVPKEKKTVSFGSLNLKPSADFVAKTYQSLPKSEQSTIAISK